MELEKNLNERINQIEKKININQNKNNFDTPSQKFLFNNISIVKPEDIDLILSWFDKKPIKFNLLLDSKIDGDLNLTFYNKCFNKCPTMIFVKTTDNLRFGGYTSVLWPENDYSTDYKSFHFSLDKRKKYKIKKDAEKKAIYFSKGYCFCFGCECDLYIRDKCSTNNGNYVGNGSYDLKNEYELNNGKKSFLVSSYEVYHVEY